MSKNEEGRSARVATMKKLIIAFLILGMILPILLCILLFIKVEQLQQQVNELSARSQLQEIEMQSEEPKKSVQETVYMSERASEPDHTEKEEQRIFISQKMRLEREEKSQQEQEKTKVYLTFDDGPSANTGAILDILKQYDIKATFFVTGKTQESYASLYRRIVDEGHTLGMHSYSHRYQDIYASADAFTQDLEQLQEFLYDTTGVWSRFYRFPGGSSNQVSEVPMQELADYLTEENIYYLDWNVSCGDATGRRLRPQQIADNVTEEVGKYRTAVVLLHDAADKTSTVEALPLIIEKLQSMEQVEMVPVSDEMNMVQHLQKN